MRLSIHYYILSLSHVTARLYEGFRDELIDIQNTSFPCYASNNGDPLFTMSSSELQLHHFFREVDTHFAHYFDQDPLRLVVVGLSHHLEVFDSLTRHRDVILGMIPGDFIHTTPQDIGRIVWPIVKHALAGATDTALRALAEAEASNGIIAGIDAVWNAAGTHPISTLFVEDDYHMTRDPSQFDTVSTLASSANLWDIFNDAIDIIIERVLGNGGIVIFMEGDSLTKLQRIALIPNKKLFPPTGRQS